MNRTRLPLWTLVLALGGACSAPTPWGTASAPAPSTGAPRTWTQFGNEPLQGARSLSRTFQRVSSAVAPAVVRIEAIRIDPGERWTRLGEGSGVVVRENGVVLTNHHVVENADGALVSFTDGTKLVAEILGRDQESDLAVLQVEAQGLEALELRDDEPAKVGEWVLAVGNPLGLGHTVTAGIVSGTGRALGIATFEDFIQTDAAINFGNSGGPLIDLEGRVIGINTAMASREVGQGIGFAIPAPMAVQVLESILETGRVQRGFLGVLPDDFSGDRAARFGYSGASRVQIARVDADTPARRAGVRVGDIVETIAGKPIRTSQDLLNTIGSFSPGSLVPIGLWRDGDQVSIDVTLAEREPVRRRN